MRDPLQRVADGPVTAEENSVDLAAAPNDV
jgi:hypothetical protein